MYPRLLPTVGRPVRIAFLGEHTSGIIVSVDDDGRGILVLTEDTETIHFTLQRTTGRFQAGGQIGPRLYFASDRADRQAA